MVNICEVVDLFLRKPFWFFLKGLSILGSMRKYLQKMGQRTRNLMTMHESLGSREDIHILYVLRKYGA